MEKQDFNYQETYLHAVQYGSKKATMYWWKIFLLGIMGGAFVALGYIGSISIQRNFVTEITTDGYAKVSGLGKFLGASIFPVGLMMCIFIGGSLFTSENLSSLAFLNKHATLKKVTLGWAIVWISNFIGCIILAATTRFANIFEGAEAQAIIKGYVNHKQDMAWWSAIGSGILCNILVAGTVWMTHSTKSTIGKVWLIWFPITLFAIGGFQHVVANMYIFALGWMEMPPETNFFNQIFNNLLPTTVGNFIGGAVILPGIYWIYSKKVAK